VGQAARSLFYEVDRVLVHFFGPEELVRLGCQVHVLQLEGLGPPIPAHTHHLGQLSLGVLEVVERGDGADLAGVALLFRGEVDDVVQVHQLLVVLELVVQVVSGTLSLSAGSIIFFFPIEGFVHRAG
jgi:hypothetical protein